MKPDPLSRLYGYPTSEVGLPEILHELAQNWRAVLVGLLAVIGLGAIGFAGFVWLWA